MKALKQIYEEVVNSNYKITKSSSESFKGGQRYFYFFKTESGLSYRISLIIIPKEYISKFIIGKYYPKAAKFITDKMNKGESIATITFAAQINKKWMDKTQTNVGPKVYLKILGTCANIGKKTLQQSPKIVAMYFSGAFKDDEENSRTSNTSQRTIIVNNLIKQILPSGWKAKQFANLILIYKPNNKK